MAAERSGPGEERGAAGERDPGSAAVPAGDPLRLGIGSSWGGSALALAGGQALLFLIQWRVAGPAAASGGAHASRRAGEGDA